jgi:sec-independent protein translocase protein TatA
LGEGLGKAIKGFKKSVHEADAIDVTPAEQSQQAQSQAASSNQVNTQSDATPSPAPQATQPGQVKQG